MNSCFCRTPCTLIIVPLKGTPKNQNLMMSIFCSHTLIFAPECWKCTLRGPDFKIFPGGMPLDRPSLQELTLSIQCMQVAGYVFSSSLPTPKLLPPIKNLVKNPVERFTIWRKHFSEYMSHMKYCIDLILGEAFFIHVNYLLSSPRFWMFCIQQFQFFLIA